MAPGKKMEWAGAWKIANVTATFIITVGLQRLKKISSKKLSMCVLQILYLKLLRWLMNWEKFKYHVCSLFFFFFFLFLTSPAPLPNIFITLWFPGDTSFLPQCAWKQSHGNILLAVLLINDVHAVLQRRVAYKLCILWGLIFTTLPQQTHP